MHLQYFGQSWTLSDHLSSQDHSQLTLLTVMGRDGLDRYFRPAKIKRKLLNWIWNWNWNESWLPSVKWDLTSKWLPFAFAFNMNCFSYSFICLLAWVQVEGKYQERQRKNNKKSASSQRERDDCLPFPSFCFTLLNFIWNAFQLLSAEENSRKGNGISALSQRSQRKVWAIE